ncbi:MAG: aminomethyl transferase family protein, partial [Ilumatobacteraceae bacterium]
MVLTTPFYERLAPLNQTQLWSHWSGYLSAVKYQMADKFEYFAIRNSAGLIDTSPLYKYRFGGRDAAKFLGAVLARDINACRDGQAQYTLWLDERGYVVEDGVVIKFAADDFILTSAEPNLAYFQRLVGYDKVEITDV